MIQSNLQHPARYFSLILQICLATVIGVADAALIDRGNGLIYDDILDITWLRNANLAANNDFGIPASTPNPNDPGNMTLVTAFQFIDALNNSKYKGFDDWRLPRLTPVNGTKFNEVQSVDGSTDHTFNISTPNSELGHLHYVSLGNPGLLKTDGTGNSLCNGANRCINNVGPFVNFDPLPDRGYWANAIGPGSSAAWSFFFPTGEQIPILSGFSRVWPVRDGDVSVIPIPSALPLFGSALILATFVSRRRSTS